MRMSLRCAMQQGQLLLTARSSGAGSYRVARRADGADGAAHIFQKYTTKTAPPDGRLLV